MMKYHAHVYFDLEQIQHIEKLYIQLKQAFGENVRYGRIHQKLIGPHTKPMFQLEFDQVLLPQIKMAMDSNGLNLSVLIHPLDDNAYLAHTQGAEWLGSPLPLNLTVFL